VRDSQKFCRFQLIGVLVASPLALLVALWGMSEVHVIEAMTAAVGHTHALVPKPASLAYIATNSACYSRQ
jgi:hypothetical protein